jgi:3-oxoacyl-[acyl-carrier protein] reductase
MQLGEMGQWIGRHGIGEDGDPGAVGCIERRTAGHPRAVAIHRPGLKDVQCLAGRQRLLGVDQADLVEPTPARQRVSEGTAEWAGSEDGNEGHEGRSWQPPRDPGSVRGMTSKPQLDGHVAIVTGGSKGIGLAITCGFVARGAKVVVSGRSKANLDAVVAELGGNVAVVPGDVADSEVASALVRTATERFGGLDSLINNAGVGTFAHVADLKEADWHRLIATNLTGVFLCSKAAIPALKRRGGGWIINISSLAGRNSFAGGAAYCASKAGLNAFAESLMLEVRQDNIRVSTVMPGSVQTAFSAGGDAPENDWKLSADDVAQVVFDLLGHTARSLPSRVEIRPTRPK